MTELDRTQPSPSAEEDLGPVGGTAEPVDLQPRPRLVAVGLAVLVLLFLSGVAGLAASIGSGNSTEVVQVVVPRLAGRSASEAQQQLERLGLIVEISFDSNELVASGTVVSQNPIAGSRLDAGQLVTLSVSDGPAGMEVPDVRGLQSSEAVSLMQTVGLMSKVEQVFDEAVRAGEAVGSSPATGARAAVGSTVLIRISKGPAPRTVPQIVGSVDSLAMAEIGRAELKIGKITQKTGSGKPNGTVLSSSPEPGSHVPRNMPVDLVVAKDSPLPLVPDVVGLARQVAEQVVRDAGLRLSVETVQVPQGDSRNGLAISQSPIAGTALASGSVVKVQVAAAPSPPTTDPANPTGGAGAGPSNPSGPGG